MIHYFFSPQNPSLINMLFLQKMTISLCFFNIIENIYRYFFLINNIIFISHYIFLNKKKIEFLYAIYIASQHQNKIASKDFYKLTKNKKGEFSPFLGL